MKVRILHRKRAVFAVLFTLLLSVVGVTNATAQSFTVGDLNYTFNDDGASVTLIGHVDGISGELVIPENVELYGTSYPVTAIGDGAFQYCYDLTGDLVIPNSVVYIGTAAFLECHNMIGALLLGNSVQNISYQAFGYCSFTGALTIPESVTEIYWGAFIGCGFTTLNFNASNCYLDGGWLSGSFTTLNLGANMTAIPDRLTSGCTTFTGSLTIPSSVTRIGDDAFNGCSGFTGALVIPEAVTYIGSSAFNGCSGFTGSLTISNAVTSIGNEAFNGCSGFTGSLTIPYTVTNIGNSAFMNCSGFSGTLTLGQSLAEIGNSAFFGACESFASFNVLAETPPTLGTNAFLSVNMEIPVSVPCGTLQAYQNTEGWSSFINFQEPDPCIWEILAMANPAIGGTVNGAGVYEQGQTCTLTATPVGDFVFSRWTENGIEVSTDAVYSFTVEGNRNLVARFTNPNFIVFADPNVENRCVELWDTDGDGYLSYDEAAAVTNLNYAFQNYWGITSFDELQYFTGLTSLNDYEFYDCESLTSITLPENITYIGYYAFAYCYSLSIINMLSVTPPELNWCTFCDTYSSNNIIVSVPCGATSNYQNIDGWNGFTNYQEPNTCVYEIVATANNDNAGTVSGSGSYQRGETCTLVATVNEGYTFVCWTENGTIISTSSTYSFMVTKDATFVAIFSENQLACGGLGYTTYDWQTNAAAITRTIVWPNGKINFAFTQANETSFNDRGTGIATYDAVNDEWIPSESRVENERTGFGSIARYGQNGIVVAAHANTQCGVYIIEDKDNITPNSVPVVSYIDNTYNLEWPNVMTSGSNRDIIHMVATANGYTSIPGMENVYQPVLYFRSQDGGRTWDKQNVVLPFMDANYGLDWGADVCYWMETTEDNCLALVVNNAWSDGMVIYSYDNGETWERKIFYKHPNPFGYNDMFFFPRWTSCQWDSQHHLHVLYEYNGCSGDPGSGSYYPTHGGVAYWNETMPYNINGTTQSAIEGNLIPGHPFVMDKDYLYNDISVP